MKSYMNIGICTILVFRKAYRGDLEDDDLPSFWASGGTLGILILAPIFFGFFLSINNHRLDDSEFLQAYGALYSNLNFSRPFSLLTPSLILLRRFILVVSLAFLGVYPWAQLMIGSISSQGMLIWIAAMKPYQDNGLEMLNKFAILLVFTLMCTFIWEGGVFDLGDYSKLRKNVGFGMMSLVALVIALNLLLAVKDILT
jgi:hypothetical protein